MAEFILNNDGTFTSSNKKSIKIKKSKKKTKEELYEELKNKPVTGQAKTKSGGSLFKKSEGNLGQAIGYSTLDALGNVTEGFLKGYEGISDWARNRGADIVDFFGADEYAKELRERSKEDDVADIVKQWNHITAGDLSGTKSEEEIGHFKNVKANTVLGDKGGQVFQGIGNSLASVTTGMASGGALATPSFFMSASGNAETEALNAGATTGEARMYGLLSGTVEALSEKMFGGLGKASEKFGLGKGALDDQITNVFTKNMKSALMKNITTLGLKSVGEGLEEVASGFGNALAQKLTYMNDEEIGQLLKDQNLMDSFVSGMLSSAIMQSPSTVKYTAQGRDINTGLTGTQQKYVNEIAQQRMVEAQKRNAKLNGYEQAKIEQRALTDYQQGRLADSSKLNQINLPGVTNKELDLQQSAYKYGFNPNSEAIVTAKTMLDNRGIKSRFDAEVFKGSNENSFWTKKADGTREVVFNPNASEQTILEEIAIHELTHDLMSSENSQEIIDNQNIINYVSKLKGYKEARANVEKLYAEKTKGMTAQQKAEYINEEIVADTLGKNIGSQEYIRRLIDDEPSIAKKIYDWVVNKVTNSKGVKNEKAYWNNVKNNFEKAYNMSYEGKGKNTKYSIGGKKGIDNVDLTKNKEFTKYVEEAKNAYNEALNMAQKGYSKEEIRNITKWYQDKNGDWKFEFTDKDFNLKVDPKNITVDKVYKLGDLVEHKFLDALYPEIMNYDVKFTQKKSQGSFYRNTKSIEINKDKLAKKNAKSSIEGTLIHEIQHAIQQIENFESGRTSKLSKQYYYESLGEAEATDTRNRMELEKKGRLNRENTPPLSFYEDAKHPSYDYYMENRGIIDKIKDSLYSFVTRGDVDEVSQEVDKENQKQNRTLVDGRGLLDNSSFFDEETRYSLTDNQGRELTKEQQEYFKDSKVRDSEGNLKVLYNGSGNHTVYLPGYMSDESHWGKGIYLTPYKDIASEYGNDVKETYVNITKPISHNTKMPFEQYNEFYKATHDGEEAYQEDYDLYDNDFDLLWDATNKGCWADYANELKQYTGYDGLIIDEIDGDRTSSMVIAFQSNQIKNVDNTNPTGDADIRKSQQTEEWQSFLDKNFESKGTKTRLSDIKLPGLTNTIQEEVQQQTSNALLPIANELRELNKNLNKVLNPTEISQLTPQDANTTPILPGITRNKVGDGKSKFFDNIYEKTNMLSDETKTAILSSDDVKYYDKVTNKESLDKAYARLQENGQAEVEDWLNKTKQTDGKDARQVTAVDVAEGWILLKQVNDAIEKETDPIRKHQLLQSSVNYAINLRDIGSKAGQVIQAFNILSRLTPEGMVYYAQKELSQAYDQMVQNKTKAWIDENKSKFELQPNEVQFILDTMKDVSTMEDGYDKRFKLAQIQKVLTDKLPPAKGAGMKAWMRISMLFNPKTQVRNVAGNALIAPVNAFGDMFASLADKVIGSKTGVRTTGNFNLKDYTSGMKKGLYESYNDFKHGVNTRNVQGNRFEVTEGKSFNDNNAIGKALNRVDNLLSFMLDAGDRGFYEASFVNSINNQMVLNNTTEVTQDMIDIATQEALSRTWQDNNEYTKFVMNVRNGLNKLNVGGYGLGDVLIPFAKTPANLTKAIVEYSPVGLIGTINKGIKLNRSLTNGQYSAKTQHEFVQSLGKATAGTMLYVLGIALANAGVTGGESDEDKDVSNFMKNTLGVNSYSIKIGNKSFTFDWAQPLAAPLAITANLVQKQKEEASLLENVVSTLDTAGNLLLEQSFMESISTVLNNNEGIATGMQEAILDLPARAIPTFLKQITDLTDGTQRQTFIKDKPIESMFNSMKAKIPGLSYTLDPSVDTLGRDIQKYGGKNNLFNVFLNPANVNTENVSESGQEIYRLYKETGETNIMPRVAPYYVNKKGKKIILSTQQRTQYQKISGSIIESNVANLLESTAYKNMSDEKKAEVINDIVNYSYNIAQNQVLGLELADTYKTAYEYAQIGNISDFYEFRNSIDDTDSTTKRISIKNYLVNSDLDDNQIANLYGNYYSSNKTLNAMLGLRIPMKEFIKFDSEDIQGQYDTNTGKTITNSKKNATIKYVNTLNLSKAQRAILVKSVYSSYDNSNNDIIRYVNTLSGTVNEKKVLLKSIGFDNYDDDVFNYINSQNLTKDEKIAKLKDLGFTVRDGRVYY